VTPIRVVHVPGRTPYARKLHDDRVQVVNGMTVDGFDVPRDVTLAWLLEHRPWDWLDVVHLHHPDFEPIPLLRAVLTECRCAEKRVVFTAHDVEAVLGEQEAHHRRLCALVEDGIPFVCLTPGADADVRRRVTTSTALIPHGYVAPPGTRRRSVPRAAGPTRFVIYGSLRPNRDVELVLACWRFARHLSETTMHLLLRSPSRASLSEDAQVWRAIQENACDQRLHVDVLPFPTDDEVNAAVADADCLLLPYRWASHSGQLEHAFDLGVLPVVPRLGYLPDQVALHRGLAGEPVWFNWSDEAPFDHGAHLLEAMQTAHVTIQNGWTADDADKFADHRRQEHVDIMARYCALYQDGQ
jgi:hypothetical protein